MRDWLPREIIIHESVRNDRVTLHFTSRCPNIPVKYIRSAKASDIVGASGTLQKAASSMLDKILAGKQVVFIGPAREAVDVFRMPDDRMICPDFDRLKLASNGCFYQCDWCYLKLTYRAAFPFITVRVQYDRIKAQIEKRLGRSEEPVIFNSGELADSLAMEHLTRAGREFIPWFASTRNGYLYMLTKSDHVDHILDLAHNSRTILTWSLNEPSVSRKYEIGAPSFDRRLEAARKAQTAGYPVRIRIDPVVPVADWRNRYAEAIRSIFEKISPERVTVGTLRFEEGFYRMRNSIFKSGADLSLFLEGMEPMFEPKIFAGAKKPKSGKYSFPADQRTELFGFIIREIGKYSDCIIALCKESAEVWRMAGLDPSRCACACQLNSFAGSEAAF